MKFKGLIGSVQPGIEDGIYDGKLERINDLVTFEGNNPEELKKSFHFVVDEHIKDDGE